VIQGEGGKTMKVKECMSREVTVASPNDTLQEAARTMGRLDVGSLPVAENDRLVGMLTDRDIAIRAVAEGLPVGSPISQAMTRDIKYVFDDEDIEEVAEQMADLQVRRLPVVNRDKRLVGIVSLGDVSRSAKLKEVGETLREVSEPGGQHSQRAS
jgi:CBS domain-containing protein